jgi:hypothetical protein
MNDEPKETKKERRDAARQARIAEARRRAKAKRRKKLLIGLVAGVLAAVLVGFALTQITGSKAKSKEALAKARAAAGCDELEEYPDAGRQHIDEISEDKRTPYTTQPPTSGDHFAQGGRPPAPDFYTEPTRRPEIYLHNLEHGQILVHYKDLPDDQVSVLEELQQDHGNSTTVMRNPEITKPVVITAWRYMQQCEKVSAEVIEHFIEERCNKSPERLTTDC